MSSTNYIVNVCMPIFTYRPTNISSDHIITYIYIYLYYNEDCVTLCFNWASLVGSAGKESAYNAGDLGSIPRLGRFPGEGKVYPLPYPGLENSMDCIVHGVLIYQITK